MSVPETAIDEYNNPVLWENYVGLAGEIFPMQAESISKSV